MPTPRDYYEILGLPKTASQDEIKAAYRKMAMQHHPDRNKEAGAEEKFKEISEAYAALSDPEKRRVYDQYGHSGFDQKFSQEDIFRGTDFEEVLRNAGFGGMGGDSPFGDAFSSMFFGGGRRGDVGNDLLAQVEIPLSEAASGTTKSIELTHSAACSTCSGSGAAPGSGLRTCQKCGGRGQVQSVRSLGGFGRFATIVPCPQCHGQGRMPGKTCPDCAGIGKRKKSEKLDIHVPAGIEDGMRLRLQDMGDWGPDGSGDLFVRVRVRPDDRFHREGDDLYQEAPITFSQAALGGKITVPTIGGQAEVKIPAGTLSHTLLRLKGEGMPRLHGRGKGDMLVRVIIQVPKNLTDKQRQLLAEMDGDSKAGKKGWF